MGWDTAKKPIRTEKINPKTISAPGFHTLHPIIKNKEMLVFLERRNKCVGWAISHPSFEEKGESFENGKGCFWLVVLPSTLSDSLRILTERHMPRNEYKAYEG